MVGSIIVVCCCVVLFVCISVFSRGRKKPVGEIASNLDDPELRRKVADVLLYVHAQGRQTGHDFLVPKVLGDFAQGKPLPTKGSPEEKTLSKAVAMLLDVEREEKEKSQSSLPLMDMARHAVQHFDGQPNSEGVLKEKGKEYGNVLWHWARADALSFWGEAAKTVALPTTPAQKNTLLIRIAREIAAAYVIQAMVLAQRAFRDSRIPPWADAVFNTVCNLGDAPVPGVQQTEKDTIASLVQTQLPHSYSSTEEHEKFSSSCKYRLCEIVGAQNLALAATFDVVFLSRFSGDHIAFLLADPKEIPELERMLSESRA